MTDFHLCLGGEIKGNRSRNRRKMGRTQIDRLLRELYAARLSGDLECRLSSVFTRCRVPNRQRQRSQSGHDRGCRHRRISTIAGFHDQDVQARAISTFRTMDIGDAHARVHWRANIRSRITGATVLTELIDLIDVRDGRIVNFSEVFVPR